MFNAAKPESREASLNALVSASKSLLADESDLIAGLSMVSAMLSFYLDDINWAGFYILKGDELVLGPFQGLPACVRIPLGKGVCGSAAQTRETIVVRDVHEFEGHIACDSASNSEIVIPLFNRGELFGVLDIDSPSVGRFTDLERKYLELLASYVNKFFEQAE